MLIKLIKSINFKEAHIENHLIHLTETFAVKLLQIVVLDVSPKQVPARILVSLLVIELTTVINNQKCTFMTSQIHRGSSVNQKQMWNANSIWYS